MAGDDDKVDQMSANGDKRVRAALHAAQDKLSAAQPSEAADRLLRAASAARTQRQRVVWLHRWGNAHFEQLAAVAACRPGCAHCCHLSGAITSTEAQVIGQVTGRRPADPAKAKTLQQAVNDLDSAQALTTRHIGAPCPFLDADQRCSIYEHRPFVCRTHLSLANDAWLCSEEAGIGADTRGWTWTARHAPAYLSPLMTCQFAIRRHTHFMPLVRASKATGRG